MSTTRIRITTSGVLNMLKEGKTREEIRNHFGLTKTELRDLFKHPKLKGRKTHRKPSFLLVDDIDQPQETGRPISSGATTSTQGEEPARENLFARRNEEVEVDDL